MTCTLVGTYEAEYPGAENCSFEAPGCALRGRGRVVVGDGIVAFLVLVVDRLFAVRLGSLAF
jgi:hypothetical protein